MCQRLKPDGVSDLADPKIGIQEEVLCFLYADPAEVIGEGQPGCLLEHLAKVKRRQTEAAWSITGNLAGLGLLPVKPGSAHVPLRGYDVQVVDATAHPVAAGQMGSLVIKLPLPPGCLPTL